MKPETTEKGIIFVGEMKKMKRILNKIWTDKGILFLLLMAVYIVPAFFLNCYYKQVILAGKTYEKFGYTLVLSGEKGDNYLRFEVRDCPESSEELTSMMPRQKGKVFYWMNSQEKHRIIINRSYSVQHLGLSGMHERRI